MLSCCSGISMESFEFLSIPSSCGCDTHSNWTSVSCNPDRFFYGGTFSRNDCFWSAFTLWQDRNTFPVSLYLRIPMLISSSWDCYYFFGCCCYYFVCFWLNFFEYVAHILCHYIYFLLHRKGKRFESVLRKLIEWRWLPFAKCKPFLCDYLTLP